MGKRDEPAKLVHTQTQAPPAIVDPVVRPAPAADARETVSIFDNRASLDDDGMRDRQPLQTAGRHTATASADVPADRDEGVVAVEQVCEPEFPPDLAEPGIDVEEDAPPRRGEQLGVADEPHDVEEEARAFRPRKSFLSRETVERSAVSAENAVGDSLLFEQSAQVGQRRLLAHIAQHLRLEAIDEGHVKTHLTEAEDVLEQRPSVSSVADAVRERRTDHD